MTGSIQDDKLFVVLNYLVLTTSRTKDMKIGTKYLVMLAIVSLSHTALAQRTHQISDVNDLTGMQAVASQGAAWLKRSEVGLDGRIMVNVDSAGDPYTVWWVIFNNPEACLDTNGVVLDPLTGDIVTLCNGPDLSVPAVGGAVINASGSITASNGKLKKNGKPAGGGVLNANIALVAGEISGGDSGLCCFGALAIGNGKGAEVHVVVDAHPVFDSFIVDLNTPEQGHRGAVFLATEE